MLFLILTIIIINLISIFTPKRLSGIEILTTSLFAICLQQMVDNFLDFKYNLYGYFEKGVQWKYMLFVLGIYPAVNILFLNFFPNNKIFYKTLVYVMEWCVFSIIFERLFLWSGTFYYSGWKTWYSAVIYPFLFIVLRLFHKFVLLKLKTY